MSFQKIEDEFTCNLCLLKQPALTFDHVPPKAVQKWKKLRVLQNFSGSVLYLREKPPGFIEDVAGGLAFKTICSLCNNSVLSLYDSEYIKLFHDMENRANIEMRDYTISGLETIQYPCNLGYVLRSILGHSLASYLVTPNWPVADSIRKFVLDVNASIQGDFYIYYWFYRGYDIKIGNGFGFMFEQDPSNHAFIHSFIKSWPLSILISTERLWVLENMPGVFKNEDLILSNGSLASALPMSFKHFIHPEWPEGGNGHDLSGIMLFNDKMALNIRATSLLRTKSLVRKIQKSRM